MRSYGGVSDDVAKEAEAPTEVVQRAPDERLAVVSVVAIHLRRPVRVEVEHQHTALCATGGRCVCNIENKNRHKQKQQAPPSETARNYCTLLRMFSQRLTLNNKKYFM